MDTYVVAELQLSGHKNHLLATDQPSKECISEPSMISNNKRNLWGQVTVY